jgi:hypothetical protein
VPVAGTLNLAVVSGAEKHVALIIDCTGPDVSLLRVENFVSFGASISTPVSLIETPRASPFSSSVRPLVSQTAG